MLCKDIIAILKHIPQKNTPLLVTFDIKSDIKQMLKLYVQIKTTTTTTLTNNNHN